MKQYTTNELISLGYKIENAKIESVDISMANHGCLVAEVVLQGDGWGCVHGAYCLGKGYLGASIFKGEEHGTEYIMQLMNVVGVDRFNDMKGKYVRVATKGWGSIIKIIGNVVEDKWFDPESIWEDKND